MIIDIIPVWLFFFISVAMVLLSIEIGYRIGRAVHSKSKTEREPAVASIASSILALLAFMLVFTFGIVSDRYDLKRALVRSEANTLRTAWYRADFLSEPDRSKTQTLLQEYVAKRISTAQGADLEQVDEQLADARRIQRELWTLALSNGRLDMDSDIGALFVESVNDIANEHAQRVEIGLNARVPTTIWIVLLSLLMLGMLGLGYHTAIADSGRSIVTPVLAVAFSLILALIAALDHPGSNLMPVPQGPLINVQKEMRELSGRAE